MLLIEDKKRIFDEIRIKINELETNINCEQYKDEIWSLINDDIFIKKYNINIPHIAFKIEKFFLDSIKLMKKEKEEIEKISELLNNDEYSKFTNYFTNFVFQKVIKNKNKKQYMAVYSYCYNHVIIHNFSKEFEKCFIEIIKNYDSEEITKTWNIISNFEKNNNDEKITKIKPKKNCILF